jgi:phosphatidylserine decarboxylase
LGMMKFGSRMDVYFPASDVEATVKRGDKVVAGETVIARLIRAEA